jgi:hypothetical protein
MGQWPRRQPGVALRLLPMKGFPFVFSRSVLRSVAFLFFYSYFSFPSTSEMAVIISFTS